MSEMVRAAWCQEHEDFAWLYSDGSGSCFYTCIVEMSSSDCRLVPSRLTVRGKPVRRQSALEGRTEQ